MKYVVILGDGMADYPVEELGGKTPLQVAHKPNMDRLARLGLVGMVKTVPDGIAPGSDVANLSVLGYDPQLYYTGRSPLEAVSMGIEMSQAEVAFRCNLVTLSGEPEYADKTLLDYCAGEITTKEARQLIAEVNVHFQSEGLSFYPGVSYRHCLVRTSALSGCSLTPPHDISGRVIGPYLPQGENCEPILQMMCESYAFLQTHPINQARSARGQHPANSIWLWGEGVKPVLPAFSAKYGLQGSVISAVDLLKGIGLCAGMRSVDVPGATGNIHTNFTGKTQAALAELAGGQDFVFLHLEAPDECGHQYQIKEKVRAIELIDEQVLGVLLDGLEMYEDYRIMVLPDHATPLSLRTHTSDPVPFVIYQKSAPRESGVGGYDESQAQRTGLYVRRGDTLMDRFLRGK
jgi:2,3-bisphosphoglycerate-independent phosphoglycerate mutase